MTTPGNRAASRGTRGGNSSRETTSDLLRAILGVMQTASTYFREVKDTIRELKEDQTESTRTLAEFMDATHKDFQNMGWNLVQIKDTLENRTTVVGNRSDSIEEEGDMLKKRAIGCIGYLKFRVAAAMLGKGSLYDFYTSNVYEASIVWEAVEYVFGSLVEEVHMKEFLGLLSTADRSGISRVFTSKEYADISKNGKLRTVQFRIAIARRRIHESIVPRIVNIWMKYADGFDQYLSSVAVKSQPKAVLLAAKEALRICNTTGQPEFCDGVLNRDAFKEA